ncbi:MAG: hypothetical protein ACXWB9_00500 [Flavisolibacter sp.]
MKLHLSANMKVKALKQQFSNQFPFLKIELFRYPHSKGQGSGFEQKVRDRLILCEVTGALKEGEVSVEPSMTVAEFEQMMQNRYGLPVQVFRKSGDLWLETIQTDSLTLEKQNHLAKESSMAGKFHFNANTLFL